MFKEQEVGVLEVTEILIQPNLLVEVVHLKLL